MRRKIFLLTDHGRFYLVLGHGSSFLPAVSASQRPFRSGPLDAAEGDGWVLTLRYDREQDRSDFVVLDANDFGGEPAAVVQLPRRVPIGLHGSWVPD